MHCETTRKSPLFLHEKAISNEMTNKAIILPWDPIIIKPLNVEIHAIKKLQNSDSNCYQDIINKVTSPCSWNFPEHRAIDYRQALMFVRTNLSRI